MDICHSQGRNPRALGWGWGLDTHASSSCFILANSSRVMELSPSPNFCSFSLEASKSGLGGAGGICSKEGWIAKEAITAWVLTHVPSLPLTAQPSPSSR